jgi:hypothetical protein
MHAASATISALVSFGSVVGGAARLLALLVHTCPPNLLLALASITDAEWFSMLTLVDAASNLWPFAHNSSNPLFGGFWVDLDVRLGVGCVPFWLPCRLNELAHTT